METINLRDFYPWYKKDKFAEVADEIAVELKADKRYNKSHERRIKRNKAQYSLDAEDGIETAAIHSAMTPDDVLALMERHCELCCALNSLPEIQGRRIEAHYILGKSKKEIAAAEGVSVSSVDESIRRGLQSMKNFLRNFENSPVKCP